MGKVLIIKNNNRDKQISECAKESYESGEIGRYNSGIGSINEAALAELKKNFQGSGIVVMITYEDSGQRETKEMYIGNVIQINKDNNIEYIMKIHLTNENHERVIKSIIDKIDLDIDKDFGYGKYVIMNDMDSLYYELRERINAIKKDEIHKYIGEKADEEKLYHLSLLAQKDERSVRIYPSDSVGKNRTEFQRDRERVVNCKAFRRLVDKAQIFGSAKGDYYRTRMTHSLEVNQIAKAIAYALGLNLDLTEAIALGHDLGHTPFGHQGERTLNDILCGNIEVGISATPEMFGSRCFGRFKHNYQSAKILTEIEEKYTGFPGLNVSVQVVEGVLKHTRLKPAEIDLADFLTEEYRNEMHIDYDNEEQICSTLEGQVVAVADEIAQRGHDVDDALTSGVISFGELNDMLKIDKCKELAVKIDKEINAIDLSERLIVDKKELKISRIVSVIINYFIQETINNSLKNIQKQDKAKMICFSDKIQSVNDYLEKVVQKKVICNNEVARADYNASMIVQTLFAKYYKNPRLLHSGTVHKIFIKTLQHHNKEVSNSAIYLSEGSIELVNKEIEEITLGEIKDKEHILDYLNNKRELSVGKEADKDIVIFEKRRILVRAITDYIAGMTDGYALEEYEKLK